MLLHMLLMVLELLLLLLLLLQSTVWKGLAASSIACTIGRGCGGHR